MCLIFLSLRQHPRYKLIIAANRDEFYNRRTAPAEYWQESPDVLAGRDLEANGTWMGVTRTGRISLLTNYRDLSNINPAAPSRGQLVSDFLQGAMDAKSYLQKIETGKKAYNGFNLIVGTVDDLFYSSNYSEGIVNVDAGLHGLSNHLLDSPWPKVIRGERKLSSVLKQDTIDPAQLFDILYDEDRANDEDLPKTGLSLERERALSSMFIKTDGYGSRCSTVVLVDHANHLLFAERVFDLKTFDYKDQVFEFDVRP